MSNKTQKLYRFSVDNLIALCYVLEDFKKFYENIKAVMGENYDYVFGHNVSKASVGEHMMSIKAKKFYAGNKEIIDKINQYSNIKGFLYSMYEINGFDVVYKYFLQNRNNIDQILALLQRIKGLGLKIVNFGEQLDFSSKTYSVSTSMKSNVVLDYFDHMEVIPDSNQNRVSYVSVNSNYKISLIGNNNPELIVNNFLFDPQLLPSSVKMEVLYLRIMELRNQRIDEYKIILESVGLSVGLNDLERMTAMLLSQISSLETVGEKKELIGKLTLVREMVSEMKQISVNHNEGIVSRNENISMTFLESEQEAYVRRRAKH